MGDKILQFLLDNFEIKNQNIIYFRKQKSYITYEELKVIIRANCGWLNDYEIDNNVTKLILFYTNDIDRVFEFFSVHTNMEYITYYSTI